MHFYGEILWELQGLSIYSNLNWMEQSENAWYQIKTKRLSQIVLHPKS